MAVMRERSARQHEDALDSLLVAFVLGLGLVDDNRESVAPDGLPDARLAGAGALGDDGGVANEALDHLLDQPGLARAGLAGNPNMRPPFQGAADGRADKPAGQE
jgi:hypothetical protein